MTTGQNDRHLLPYSELDKTKEESKPPTRDEWAITARWIPVSVGVMLLCAYPVVNALAGTATAVTLSLSGGALASLSATAVVTINVVTRRRRKRKKKR